MSKLVDQAEVEKFQFHKGTIKTGVGERVGGLCHNFNSIKVRLKLSEHLQSYVRHFLFQFHKGTIKTSSRTP